MNDHPYRSEVFTAEDGEQGIRVFAVTQEEWTAAQRTIAIQLEELERLRTTLREIAADVGVLSDEFIRATAQNAGMLNQEAELDGPDPAGEFADVYRRHGARQ